MVAAPPGSRYFPIAGSATSHKLRPTGSYCDRVKQLWALVSDEVPDTTQVVSCFRVRMDGVYFIRAAIFAGVAFAVIGSNAWSRRRARAILSDECAATPRLHTAGPEAMAQARGGVDRTSGDGRCSETGGLVASGGTTACPARARADRGGVLQRAEPAALFRVVPVNGRRSGSWRRSWCCGIGSRRQ